MTSQGGELRLSRALAERGRRIGKDLALRLPIIGPVIAERDALRRVPGWPAGHFYSPIPSLEEVRRDEHRIFGPPTPTLPGLELNVPGQLLLLDELRPHYAALPFADHSQEGVRYHYVNDYFSYGEAIVLFALIRHLRPQRIVEVGSGFSSAVMLDALDTVPDLKCSLTCVEPYPDRLTGLLRDGGETRMNVLQERVQDVELGVFDALEAGDILFVDSSHVSKVGSDVHHLVFEVLPRLRPGVFIHVHDVGYPFEYPKTWIYEGRAWNEAYLMRAFLQYNARFEIRLFHSMLGEFHIDSFAKEMPLIRRNPGTSLWLSVADTG